MDVTEFGPFFFWCFPYGFRHNKTSLSLTNIATAIFADFRTHNQYLLLHITKIVFRNTVWLLLSVVQRVFSTTMRPSCGGACFSLHGARRGAPRSLNSVRCGSGAARSNTARGAAPPPCRRR